MRKFNKSDLEEFQNLSAFGAISTESIEYLVNNGDIINLDSGSVLFSAGETADEFYIVLEGCLGLYKEDNDSQFLIREFLPGDQIGVTAMITFTHRPGQGVAISPSKVIRITTALFNGLYSTNKQDFILLIMNMFRDMARGLKTERNGN